MNAEHHIVFQNTPDILDPQQVTGATGKTADTILHLLARANHTALTGDQVIVGQNTPEDFLGYMKAVTGQEPEILRAGTEVPLFTSTILDAIDVPAARDHLLDPYIQWGTIADFSKKSGIKMAYTPADTILQGVVEVANNKAYMRRTAESLGIPIVPDQIALSVNEPQQLASAILDMAQSHSGTFFQAELSGGGFGNVDLRMKDGKFVSAKLGEGTPNEMRTRIMDWAAEIRNAGSKDVVIAPMLDMIASHTVSGFIPKDGDPIVYGLFKQLLADETYDYMGFEWPARDQYTEQYGQEMMDAAKRWFGHLQKMGYIGPSDVDYLIGSNPKLGTILAASESNTRWDGFRFGMQHAANTAGWNLRTLEGINNQNNVAVTAVDHVSVNRESVTDLVEAFSGNIPLLGIDHEDRVIVVMVPPSPKNGHYEAALAAVGTSNEEAVLIMNEAKRLSGIYS